MAGAPVRRVRLGVAGRPPPTLAAAGDPRGRSAALRQHVGIAAGIFDPAAVAFGRDRPGHRAVEEIAVVTDEEHRAGEARDQLPATVSASPCRGRWSARRAPAGWRAATAQRASDQPRPLAAGQRRPECAPPRPEQEILHVADDMAWLAIDDDRLATPVGQRCRQRLRGSTAARRWSSVAISRLTPSRTMPESRASCAGQHLEQRRLAGAIRADHADAVAALDAGRQSFTSGQFAELFEIDFASITSCRIGASLGTVARPRRRVDHARFRIACKSPAVASCAAPGGHAVAIADAPRARSGGQLGRRVPLRGSYRAIPRKRKARPVSSRPWSSHTVARLTRSRKGAACEMTTRAEDDRRVRLPAIDHGKVEWLVGSSSSRMPGSGAIARASAARRASPPESDSGFRR